MNKKPALFYDPLDTATAIKRLRKIKGMSQKQLATQASITEDYVSKLETKKKNPSLSVLTRIATALNVTLNSLWLNAEFDSEPKYSYKQVDYIPEVGGRLIHRAVEHAFEHELKNEYLDVKEIVILEFGITYSYYREIVRGDKTPSLELLAQIATVLGVTMDSLVFDNPD